MYIKRRDGFIIGCKSKCIGNSRIFTNILCIEEAKFLKLFLAREEHM